MGEFPRPQAHVKPVSQTNVRRNRWIRRCSKPSLKGNVIKIRIVHKDENSIESRKGKSVRLNLKKSAQTEPSHGLVFANYLIKTILSDQISFLLLGYFIDPCFFFLSKERPLRMGVRWCINSTCIRCNSFFL